MRLFFFPLIACCLALGPAYADNLQVYKLQPTPVSDQSKVRIRSNTLVKKGDKIHVQVESFPVGVNTQSEYFRESKFRESLEGSTVLLVFNGKVQRSITTADNNPYIEQRSYFNKRFRKQIDPALAKEIGSGQFLVVAILVNSYGETVKIPGSADAVDLYYIKREKTEPPISEDLKKRALYYNQPRGSYIKGQPILLDFYLQNTRLSPSSDQVLLYIDGKPRAYLTEWAPYSIRGLEAGKHNIRLELIDSSGKAYPEPFGSQQETIEVR